MSILSRSMHERTYRLQIHAPWILDLRLNFPSKQPPAKTFPGLLSCVEARHKNARLKICSLPGQRRKGSLTKSPFFAQTSVQFGQRIQNICDSMIKLKRRLRSQETKVTFLSIYSPVSKVLRTQCTFQTYGKSTFVSQEKKKNILYVVHPTLPSLCFNLSTLVPAS